MFYLQTYEVGMSVESGGVRVPHCPSSDVVVSHLHTIDPEHLMPA